ncbi:MAG: hypothetical protein FWD49_04680 [Firmicutes bacterium]|nr:hypothetical protein [Bacillota bacterium]
MNIDIKCKCIGRDYNKMGCDSIEDSPFNRGTCHSCAQFGCGYEWKCEDCPVSKWCNYYGIKSVKQTEDFQNKKTTKGYRGKTLIEFYPIGSKLLLTKTEQGVYNMNEESKMRVPKIYLETTIFNYVFEHGRKDEQSQTIRLFEEIKAGKYLAYTSQYVVDELDDAPEPRRTQMFDLLKEHKIGLIPSSAEIERLANVYIADGIISKNYLTDARHIAATSATNLDVIVSWNFQHIVRLKTIAMTEIANLKEGYKKIIIISPREVIDHERI